ncbi:Oxoglutarate/iron-dependent dioxygenase [Corchorus olitorius]|uniref:Oxoglutarate/iron-dependent dioxygenase n=1 Tax=Corchorus olitorius TaxID=93759 RepID=A0A1R3JPH9_9ROSI|nr:Oxoglutarate/iron-dependent dioxygenase [Corchorus olitorius]
MEEEKMGWGSSLSVPSIQEILRNDSISVPERFIQEEKDRPQLVSENLPDSPEIPVIDFSLLAKGDEDERRKLDLACKEWGFFQISNHGIEKEVLHQMKIAVSTFFQLPLEEKNKFAMAENDIQGFGQAYVVSEEQKLDWNDMIYLKTLPSEIRNFKFWPLTCPGFKEAVDKYSTEVQNVAAEIYANLSILMGLGREGLKELQGEIKQGIRMSIYPSCSRPDLVLGISPHSDGSALTLLLQDDEITALQIKHKESWVNVKPIPDSLVVNVGDAIEILSNGVYKSIEHRAITNEKKDRISIAAFVFPDEEQEIGPLESMVDELHCPRRYRKIKYVDYIRQIMAMKMEGKAHTDIVKLEIK